MDKIGNSSFTIDWVVQKLQEDLNVKSAQLETFNLTTLVAGADTGILSQIWKLKLNWNENENSSKLPKNIILKIPQIEALNACTDEKILQAMPLDLLKMLHTAECKFYGMFGKSQNPPLPIPYCFVAQNIGENNEPGILVLEDASINGQLISLDPGLNLKQCLSFVEAQAGLHAASILQPKLIDQYRFFAEDDLKVFEAYYESAKEVLPQFLPEFGELLPKISSIFHSTSLYRLHELNHSHNVPNVLTHGDPWVNNIFYSKSGDQNSVQSIIDWQFCNPGSPTIDLARFQIWNCTPEMRKETWEKVLEFYYEKLGEKLGKNPNFSLENLKNLYKAQFGAALAWFTLDAVTIITGPSFSGSENLGKAVGFLGRLKSAIEDWILMQQ